MSEAEVCTAAFFRSIGKEAATKKEFTMTVSLNLRWISVKDAPRLLDFLAKSGCVSIKGDYIKPAIDISLPKVPITYKPSAELCMRATELPASPPVARTDESGDVFSEMISYAEAHGISGKELMSESRKLSKSTGITQTAAAFVVLCSKTRDATKYYDAVAEEIRNN